MMTVVRSHSWMMSRLVTAGGIFFCDRLSRGRSVLGCSRCWDLGWSSLIVLRLRHRNCECYRGSNADSEYGRHLFHRFTYGSKKASGLKAFPENRQRCVQFLAFLCRHRLRRRAALIVGDRNCAVGRGKRLCRPMSAMRRWQPKCHSAANDGKCEKPTSPVRQSYYKDHLRRCATVVLRSAITVARGRFDADQVQISFRRQHGCGP